MGKPTRSKVWCHATGLTGVRRGWHFLDTDDVVFQAFGGWLAADAWHWTGPNDVWVLPYWKTYKTMREAIEGARDER